MKTFYILLLMVILFSCNDEKFRAQGASGGKDSASIDCSISNKNDAQTVRADYGNGAVVDAQLCPQSLGQNPANPVQVMFIVDFSGSMDKADKLENGRCDRMAAAEVVVRNYLAAVRNPQAVQFSVISFEASASILASKVPGTSFKTSDPNLFCKAIQKEKDYKSNTNYEAAFQKADELISSFPNAEKRIYFLSDGKPGASSSVEKNTTETYDEIVDRAMKDAMVYIDRVHSASLVEIYAMFLDWEQTSAEKLKVAPFDLMSQLTGKPGNVKVVEESSFLPTLIQDLTPKVNTQITPDQILIEVRASGYPSRTFKADAKSFVWDGSETSPISFKTLPMQLFGEVGKVVRNQILVSARDSRFSSVVFYIDWDQTNSSANFKLKEDE